MLLACFFTACAQKKDHQISAPDNINYTLKQVVSDLHIPWGMAFLPNGGILITERSGALLLYINNKKIPIKGLPEIERNGQGGLMDIELHPNYRETGWIYISFASSGEQRGGSNTAIARAKLHNNTLIDLEVLYKATPNSSRGQHYGSRLEFDKHGDLYFSIGDRGNRNVNPQNLSRDGGKIYRIKDNGAIPEDNPFLDKPTAKKAIYSYGHRNPQGLIRHPQTGAIWSHEHGPRGGDEINLIKKGSNYGWPLVTYGINYSGTPISENTSLPGMENPIYQWTPSIAPCGMTFVMSDKYPEWEGNLLVGSLSFQYLERLVIRNEKVEKRERLFDGIGRVRNVKQGPDGFLYVAVEGKGIYKIVRKSN